MEKKDSYLLPELILTLLLLFFVIQLLIEVLPIDGLYLIYALAGGGYISWFLRNRRVKLTRAVVTTASFGVMAWLMYSILSSSLSYRDVLTISIKGIFILEVILAFASCIPSFVGYIQALSVPLFMSHPIFIKSGYNETSGLLSLGYFITWLAIVKVKFYESFKPKEGRKIEPLRYGLPAAAFLLLIVISSWAFFSRFPLGRIEKWGFFQEEEEFLGDRKTEEEYYDLQDKIQRATTKLIPEFDSTAKKQEALFLLSSLIKDSSHTARTEKAEIDLISLLKEPGPGLEPEDREALDLDIKNYVDKKSILDLRKAKNNMSDILKRQPMGIKNRISILSRVNKILYSSSYGQVDKYKNQAESIIRNMPSPDTAIKAELEESVEGFKELRINQIYRRKVDSFAKAIAKLEDKLKEEFNDLSLEIRRLEKADDFKKMDEKLRELKKSAPDERKDFIKELEEISGLRLEAVLSERARDSKERAAVSAFHQNKGEELKDRGLLAIEAYHSSKNIKGRIENILKKSALSGAQKEELLGEVTKLESSGGSGALESGTKRLQDYVDTLKNRGFIFPEDRDELIKEIERAKGLSGPQDDAGREGAGLTPEAEKTGISEKRIISIRTDPDYLRIPLGENGEFSAIGVYSDNSHGEVTQLAQWRSSDAGVSDASIGKISTFSTGEAKIYAEYQGIESAPALVIVEQPKLISIILSPQHSQISILDTLLLKAEGNFSDFSRQDITSSVDWESDKPNILQIGEGKVRPRRCGETMVYAAYSGIRSLPVGIKVIMPWGLLIAAGICCLALGLIIMFSALYLIIEIKKKKLKLYIENNPKEFIIKLYENMRHILDIFNLGYEKHTTPLYYAALVGSRYSAEKNIFLRFTARFEEAKYSQHVLQQRDAAAALDDYNIFLKMFFSHQHNIILYHKYCLALLRRIPLFIF